MSHNPLLDRLLPGTQFTLPSMGLFYKDGELDDSVKEGAVTVHALSTHDELIMRSPDMVFTGQAIDVVFRRCIPQILEPSKLMAKDVDFLLAALRVVTYGATLDIQYDHGCQVDEDGNTLRKVRKYNINLMSILQSATRIDPTNLESVYSHSFSNGQVVKFRPMTFAESLANDKAIFELADDVTIEALSLFLAETLASMIVSVDNVTDQDLIVEWLSALNASWTEELRLSIDNANDWGIDFNQKVQCSDCGEDVNVQIWTSPSAFFT